METIRCTHKCRWVMAVLIFGACFSRWSCVVEGVLCSEIDRNALLRFKAGIVEDPTGALSSWEGEECCNANWNGVGCDPDTGRVILIDLRAEATNDSMYMTGTISKSMGQLSSLLYLRLIAWKNISGKIPSSMARLSNLDTLSLDQNKLSGNMPWWAVKFPNLRILGLSENRLKGRIPAGISNLSKLVRLVLDHNRISGPIPLSIGNLSNLETLHLNDNFLSGPIPDSIGSIQALFSFNVSNNMLTGSMPSSLGNLSGLAFLSVNKNKLSGTIPPSLGRLSRLAWLSLSDNLVTGTIPASLGNIVALDLLDLSRNNLEGPIPQSFRNFAKLSTMYVSGNKLSGSLPKLKLPSFLDLSYNNLKLGTIPQWITRADYGYLLNLAGCGIKMRLQDWKPFSAQYFYSIDLSSNEISGDAVEFFKTMTFLSYANLSNNQLKYNLSNGLTYSYLLRSLDVHSNQLYGSIGNVFNDIGRRACGIGGCLEYVDLSANNLSGQLIPKAPGQVNLKWLDVSDNHLNGSIPSSIGKLKRMEHLDLSQNGLTGKIPNEMLDLKKLKELNASYNYLCGQIPQGKPLNQFPASSYAHNKCLCGFPLPPCYGHHR